MELMLYKRRIKMRKDSIGNRMKENYEYRYRIKLTKRIPVIIRLDGKAFHTLTKKCDKPFDENFSSAMENTVIKLCNEIQGVKCAYIQSDEISLLLTDFDRFTTEAWFDYNKSKIESISASLASVYFTKYWNHCNQIGIFDSRSFNIPKEEVRNYFIWRQLDWIRNSISMLAQSVYSHKQLNKKNQRDMHEMLYTKGINWADLSPKWKNGISIYKQNGEWVSRGDIIFTSSSDLIEYLLKPIEK
jgi:tRNA(His) 5'-end guanylyltransferase